MRGYDAWLEAPFQRMCAEQERAEVAVDDAIAAGDLPPEPTDAQVEAYLEKLAADDAAEAAAADEAAAAAWRESVEVTTVPLCPHTNDELERMSAEAQRTHYERGCPLEARDA